MQVYHANVCHILPVKVKHESGLPPLFTKWCVRTVSVWIIGSLGVAVTSCSPRSCLRKSSMTSPARVNRIQIKTRQNWNTKVGLGNVSTADTDWWHQTVCMCLSVCANKESKKLGLLSTEKERWCCMTMGHADSALMDRVHDLSGTESPRDCSYHNPPRWSTGTPSLLSSCTSSSNSCGL